MNAWVDWFRKTPAGNIFELVGMSANWAIVGSLAYLARGNPEAIAADPMLWSIQWIAIWWGGTLAVIAALNLLLALPMLIAPRQFFIAQDDPRSWLYSKELRS